MNLENFQKQNKKIQDDLTQKYPSIFAARSCIAQKDYFMAAEIYSDILESARQFYPENNEHMCNIYLEYCHSLIYASIASNYDKVKRLSQGKTCKFGEEEDDLEIAWELLEICRITFTATKNESGLKLTHFLLGDVLMNNDKMEEAISEYEKAEKDDETMYRMALCYEFMEEFEKCLVLMKQIKSSNKELMDEINAEIEIIEVKLRSGNVPKIKEESSDSDEEVIEIKTRPKTN